MTDLKQEYISEFDALFDLPDILKYKIIFSFFPEHNKAYFCIYIKLLELKQAIVLLNPQEANRKMKPPEKDFDKLLELITPYLRDDENQNLQVLLQIFKSISQYKNIFETFESLKELFPDGDIQMDTILDAMKGGLF